MFSRKDFSSAFQGTALWKEKIQQILISYIVTLLCQKILIGDCNRFKRILSGEIGQNYYSIRDLTLQGRHPKRHFAAKRESLPALMVQAAEYLDL